MAQTVKDQLALSIAWFERLPPEQWSVYETVMSEARRRGLQFAIGGGFATMTYTGQWRETKDIDLFILKGDKDRMIRVLSDSGLEDYYSQQEYERHWIYRSYKEDIIVDVIWAMANRRAVVDEYWLQGPELEVHGHRFRMVPAEETLWSKLYVLQRDRCDWPDALSLLYSIGPELNWQHLLKRIGGDAPLLSGVLSVFGWLCPERAQELPAWLWKQFRAWAPELEGHCGRADLLDSRPWFPPATHNTHLADNRNND